MEIDITEFLHTEAPADYSASIAELGQDAGRITWRAAQESAADYVDWIRPHGAPETIRAWLADFGAWSREELAAMPNRDILALLIQFVAGDIREAGIAPDWTDADWQAFETDDNRTGRLYRGDNGRVYFYVGT